MAIELDDVQKRYLAELLEEKERLDPSCVHAARFIAEEIDRIQTGPGQEKMLELHNDKPTSLAVKILLPVKEYPKVNFAGRIIGPKGSEMKRFQEKTGTKLFVFGKGSMSDKAKEEELRALGGKYAHLNQDLHVRLEVFAHPVECYRRMSIALHELRAYLGADDPKPFGNPAMGIPGPIPGGHPGVMGPRGQRYPEPWRGPRPTAAIEPASIPTRATAPRAAAAAYVGQATRQNAASNANPTAIYEAATARTQVQHDLWPVHVKSGADGAGYGQYGRFQ